MSQDFSPPHTIEYRHIIAAVPGDTLREKYEWIEAAKVAGKSQDCGRGCGVVKPYGFVPECGCLVHDPEPGTDWRQVAITADAAARRMAAALGEVEAVIGAYKAWLVRYSPLVDRVDDMEIITKIIDGVK